MDLVNGIRKRLALAWLRGHGRRLDIPSGLVEAWIAAEELRPGHFDMLRVESDMHDWFDKRSAGRLITR